MIYTRKFLTPALGALMMAAAPMTASAVTVNALTNGSFEEDPGTFGDKNGNKFASMPGSSGSNSWDIWGDSSSTFGDEVVPGWTHEAGRGLELQTRNTIPLSPFDGDYYAELDSDNNSTISQMVALDPGRDTFSFAYSPRVDDNTTNGISFTMSGLFSDDAKGPGGDYGSTVGDWTEISREFTVTSAVTSTVTFDASTTSDSFGGFVDAVTVAPVPVPAAGIMLLTALGGLGGAAGLRRRRKTA